MSKRILTVALMFAFGLSACGTPESDLNNFCEIVEEVLKDDSKAPDKKAIAIFKKVSMTVSTKEAKDLLMSLTDIPEKKRYKTLIKGAKKLGLKKYKCKAAKKWWKGKKKKKKK